MRYKRIASILGVSAMLVGSVIGAAGEASAYPRVNVCGSSYGSLKQYEIRSSGPNSRRVGWIDTYYSSSTGKNCAIARGDDAQASGFSEIWVGIGLSGTDHWAEENGQGSNYTKYAGPVYVYAPGSTCIDVGAGLFYGDGQYASGGGEEIRC